LPRFSQPFGNMSGSTQQIGNFSYGNYTTPAGQWNTATPKIGSVEYHTHDSAGRLSPEPTGSNKTNMVLR
jgi:hypothetical protein